MDIAQEMLTKFNDDPDLLKKFVTSDELWLYGYDTQCGIYPEKLAKKAKMDLKKLKKTEYAVR